MNKRGIATIYIVIFVVCLVLFVGYAFYNNYQRSLQYKPTPTPTPTNTATNIATNTASTSTNNFKITSTTYPNTNLTPGDVMTYDSVFLCNPGTPEKLSINSSDAMKRQVFAEYHLSYPPTTQYQIDRFIPISLGGSNNIKNLWPQPASPIPGYHEKDEVEQYLYTLMCNNTINITTAQNMIKTDWVAVWKRCCK